MNQKRQLRNLKQLKGLQARVFRIATERERDPNILFGKDFVYAFYQMMGMDVDYDDIFAD